MTSIENTVQALQRNLPNGCFNLQDSTPPWQALHDTAIDLFNSDTDVHEAEILLAVAQVLAQTEPDFSRRRVLATLYATHLAQSVQLLRRFRARQT